MLEAGNWGIWIKVWRVPLFPWGNIGLKRIYQLISHPVGEKEPSLQQRLGEISVHISEPSPLRKVRKVRKVERLLTWMTMSWKERGQEVYRNTLQIINQGTNTVGCLSQEGRHQTDARIIMIWVMINWQQHAGLMGHEVWGKKLWGNRGCWCQEGEGQLFRPTNLCKQRKRLHVFFAQLMQNGLLAKWC